MEFPWFKNQSVGLFQKGIWDPFYPRQRGLGLVSHQQLQSNTPAARAFRSCCVFTRDVKVQNGIYYIQSKGVCTSSGFMEKALVCEQAQSASKLFRYIRPLWRIHTFQLTLEQIVDLSPECLFNTELYEFEMFLLSGLRIYSSEMYLFISGYFPEMYCIPN